MTIQEDIYLNEIWSKSINLARSPVSVLAREVDQNSLHLVKSSFPSFRHIDRIDHVSTMANSPSLQLDERE